MFFPRSLGKWSSLSCGYFSKFVVKKPPSIYRWYFNLVFQMFFSAVCNNYVQKKKTFQIGKLWVTFSDELLRKTFNRFVVSPIFQAVFLIVHPESWESLRVLKHKIVNEQSAFPWCLGTWMTCFGKWFGVQGRLSVANGFIHTTSHNKINFQNFWVA